MKITEERIITQAVESSGNRITRSHVSSEPSSFVHTEIQTTLKDSNLISTSQSGDKGIDTSKLIKKLLQYRSRINKKKNITILTCANELKMSRSTFHR